MSNIPRRGSRFISGEQAWLLLAAMGCGGVCAGEAGYDRPRDSMAGESAAQTFKRSIENEDYNLRCGPVRFRSDASLAGSYTDNVFYSQNAKEDYLVRPEITLAALWPVTELNTLRLSLGLAYEWYAKNRELNTDAPLVNPGSELVFHLFVGDFRILLHERFSYQESLFFNNLSDENARFYNFNDVGTFSRLNNEAGFDVDWDLNKVVLSAGYNHENFISTTDSFDYLDRSSEWFRASARFSLGDKAQIGLESQAGLHDYERETTLNDNWRVRVGPFVEVTLLEKVQLRAGGGFDMARYSASAPGNNNYESYYGYARIRQETRHFSHSLAAGREYLLGDNANNLRTTYARYSISSPIVAHLDLEANLSVNFAEEFGGTFEEEFTYYGAGFRLGSQFHKYWRADVGYEFRLKESDLASREFHRNRVTIGVTYSF